MGCGFHEAVRGVLSHHVVIRAARSPTIIPIRRPAGTPAHATIIGTPALMKTQSKTRRSLKRTAPKTSRESTSCERCGVSIRACRAECICISVLDENSRSITRPCSARRVRMRRTRKGTAFGIARRIGATGLPPRGSSTPYWKHGRVSRRSVFRCPSTMPQRFSLRRDDRPVHTRL